MRSVKLRVPETMPRDAVLERLEFALGAWVAREGWQDEGARRSAFVRGRGQVFMGELTVESCGAAMANNKGHSMVISPMVRIGTSVRTVRGK